MAQMVKRLPIMWETQVQSRVGKNLLEKEMATHSSILAWRIPLNYTVHGVAESQTQRNNFHLTSLVAQTVKHLPERWETRVRSLGREDPLEKEMATHSSILAWEIPWTEEPGCHSPWGRKESDPSEHTHTHTHTHTLPCLAGR